MARNIIGESFDPYVKEQIKVRQEKLGLGLKDIDVARFENTNTAFIRLTSGVDVDDTALANLGLSAQTQYKNSGLAKAYKLFSARTLDDKGNETFTKGFGYNNIASYGFSSNPDYGFVPPPGIVSADIKAMNRGSLREANIEIQCHNLLQFQILEVLYLRLKYSILLEWGHSVYFDNKGNLVQSRHDLSDEFLAGGIDQQDMLNLIRDERKNSNGNYDAFFGLVTNFSWTLRPDGGYNITVTARSAGDVIESLKINTNYGTKAGTSNSPSTNTSGSTPPPSALQANYYKSTINRILTSITNQVYPGKAYAHGVDQGNGQYCPVHNYNIEWMAGLKSNFNRDSQTDVKGATDHLVWNEIIMFLFPEGLSGGTWGNRQYYMKLGTLLRLIESFLIYYDTSKLNKVQKELIASGKTDSSLLPVGYGSPLFKIDYNYNNNTCFTFPRHCSIDPKICLIPVDNDVNVPKGLGYQYKDTIYTYYFTEEVGKTNNEISFVVERKKGATADDPFADDVKINPIHKDTPQTTGTTNIEDLSQANITISVSNQYLLQDIDRIWGTAADSSQDQYVEDFKTLNGIYKTFKQASGFTIPATNQRYVISVDNNKTFLNQFTNYYGGGPSLGGAGGGGGSSTVFNRYKQSIIVREYFDPAKNIAPPQTGVIQPGSELFTQIQNCGFKTDGKPYVGNLMHMYVNMEFIASTLDRYVNVATGEIGLYDFLDTLMKGIQNALGNVNNFEITYDEDNNTFKIIDNTFIPGIIETNNPRFEIVQFNGNVLKNNYGSFIKSVNFKTKLSNNFATMTTVGAQANGNAVGSNSTMLSKWNVGLSDRIITDRANTNGVIDTGSVDVAFANNIISLQEFNGKLNAFQVTDNDIASLKGGIVDLFKQEIGTFTNEGKIPGIGFIPFDLELTMLGLSGPRIYETYTIDTTLLPAVYKDKVQFICSGVSHRISDNEWTTTLNSICGPRYEGVKISNPPNVTNIKKIDVPKEPDQLSQGNGISTPPASNTGVYEVYTQGKLRKNYFDITKHHSYNSLKTHAVTPPGGASTVNWTVGYRKSNYIGKYSGVPTYSQIQAKNKNEEFVVFDWVLKRNGNSDVLVPAPFDGKVVAGGLKSGGGATTYGGTDVVVDSGGNSYYALVSTDGSKTAIFLHMREMYFKVGDTFSKGQGLGIQASVGPTSTGTHLHIEAMALQDAIDYFNFVNSLSSNYDGKTNLA